MDRHQRLPNCLQKIQELGEFKGINTIRGHRSFEEVMVADQVNNEAGAGYLLARVQVRDLPVDRAMSDSQAYRALSAVRVGRPRTNLKTLSHVDPAVERSQTIEAYKTGLDKRAAEGKLATQPHGLSDFLRPLPVIDLEDQKQNP